MNILSLSKLSVKFGTNEVLRGIDLNVAARERIVLFGPSGVGKTVMLRAIAGLEPMARGRVYLEGKDVSAAPPEARHIGVAFQNFALYPHMSAWENIASPLRAQKCGAEDMTHRVKAIASMLRIDHVLNHLPRALSNGQKQRTALARALVASPRLILFDDPLRNVDAKLRYEMRIELPRLLARQEIAGIYVTQDFREAMAMGERVAVLLDGRIAQCALPEEIYDQPATIPIARLFGDPPMNLIPARATASASGTMVEVGGWRRHFRASMPEGPVFGVRPEAITLHAETGINRIPVHVMAVTPVGEHQIVLLRLADGTELVASVKALPDMTELFAGLAPKAGALFDSTSGLAVASAPDREGWVA